ncbi:MAG: hypothetical protein ACKVQA_09745 [Burkholderiales bacterium]
MVDQLVNENPILIQLGFRSVATDENTAGGPPVAETCSPMNPSPLGENDQQLRIPAGQFPEVFRNGARALVDPLQQDRFWQIKLIPNHRNRNSAVINS